MKHHATALAAATLHVPPSTFHLARFHGPGPSTRLAITRFVGNTALVDP
jgi:hypothetical protein